MTDAKPAAEPEQMQADLARLAQDDAHANAEYRATAGPEEVATAVAWSKKWAAGEITLPPTHGVAHDPLVRALLSEHARANAAEERAKALHEALRDRVIKKIARMEPDHPCDSGIAARALCQLCGSTWKTESESETHASNCLAAPKGDV